MLYYVMLCYIMLYYVILCYIMLYYVILCYIMLYNIYIYTIYTIIYNQYNIYIYTIYTIIYNQYIYTIPFHSIQYIPIPISYHRQALGALGALGAVAPASRAALIRNWHRGGGAAERRSGGAERPQSARP